MEIIFQDFVANTNLTAAYEELDTDRVVRISARKFPHYFAILSRVREEVIKTSELPNLAWGWLLLTNLYISLNYKVSIPNIMRACYITPPHPFPYIIMCVCVRACVCVCNSRLHSLEHEIEAKKCRLFQSFIFSSDDGHKVQHMEKNFKCIFPLNIYVT